jgi:hypothetical protein
MPLACGRGHPDVDLVSINQMLAPMCEHNKHEALKGTLVPAGVQLRKLGTAVGLTSMFQYLELKQT